MLHLIDRRPSSRGRSAVNRERFLRRYKSHIQDAVKKMVGERKLADMEQGGEVRVPKKDISEPSFGFGHGGDREFVLPGNREFVAGDHIPRPQGGGSGGNRGQAGEGDSEDAFVFSLSRDEFMQIFFDDLELPNLARTELGQTEQKKSVRAGFAKTGVPANLAIVRTLRQSLARRIALGGSLAREIVALEAEFAIASAAGHAQRAAEIYSELERIGRRRGELPFIDEPDLRYRARVLRPEPIARAVMFCLMDVSASMDEEKKDLAKRFFTLLYLFLTRKYGQVDLVFIRHTDDAEEVDEDTFFHDTRSGGTVVYSALDLADNIRAERYPRGWNVYVAQASDGDAFGADPARSARFLREKLLPATRYYAYLELASPNSGDHPSALWSEYERVADTTDNLAMRKASERDQIYPVFRELFRKESQA
ncbi:MAG TPA: YeaH/YhbH family protein [Casimicrobiaceae bacterium]|nr:YeaH/YhbH family protein [Casimicrobiaceae bacterium]